MKKGFPHTAKLVKQARKSQRISQDELARDIGYRNGQFFSNVERGLCGIPAGRVRALAKELKIQPMDILRAAIDDFEYRYLKGVRAL